MFKKTVTYEDYNGEEQTEDFYFNLNKVEVMELEYSLGPGESLTNSFMTIARAEDYGTILSIIKKILLMSYGEKSPDGKRFIKNDELRTAFEQSAAFETIFWDFGTNEESFADFFVGVLPNSTKAELGDNPKQMLMDKASELKSKIQ
jgi:hypothetical protein